MLSSNRSHTKPAVGLNIIEDEKASVNMLHVLSSILTSYFSFLFSQLAVVHMTAEKSSTATKENSPIIMH